MIYEKETDREKEREIADFVFKKYSVQMKQNEPLADIDYVGTMEDGAKVNIELRCRNHVWGKYKTIWIKAGKLAKAMKAYSNGVRFMFIVMTNDKTIGRFECTNENLHLLRNAWGGRTDRNDPNDMEWVVEIPVRLFDILREKDLQR